MTSDLLEFAKLTPISSGIYLMKHSTGEILYIGKAKNLRSRLSSYFRRSDCRDIKTKWLVGQVKSIEYILTNSEEEALFLEAQMIKKHRPRYNIRLKDDKAYPYIRMVMSHDFPRLVLARKAKADGDAYFGPYSSGAAVYETIRFLNGYFQLRDCRDIFMTQRLRPCLTYEIGRCQAPCVDLIDKKKYRENVNKAIDFLKGRKKKLLEDLEHLMYERASQERFEEAAHLRDALRSLKMILSNVHFQKRKSGFEDWFYWYSGPKGAVIETMHIREKAVIGSQTHYYSEEELDQNFGSDIMEYLPTFLNQFYMENIAPDRIFVNYEINFDLKKIFKKVLFSRWKKNVEICTINAEHDGDVLTSIRTNAKLNYDSLSRSRERMHGALKELQTLLKLKTLPLRIECYDVSTHQGSDTTASQVVALNGLPQPREYRHYKIQTVEGMNDFKALCEVLKRRLFPSNGHSPVNLPDVILIDGGRPQVLEVEKLFKEIGCEIPFVGLAKSRTESAFDKSRIQRTEERIVFPGSLESIPLRSQTLTYRILVGLRDEAHRFALKLHRERKGKALLSSRLDNIKGLGPKRKEKLFRSLKPISDWSQLSVEEIKTLSGLPKWLCVAIQRELRM